MHHKWQSYDVWFLRYGVPRTECFVILDCSLPFTPLAARKMKISKIWIKKAWRYQHFTHVYQKSWSYAILFLRYGVTDAIVIFHFGIFFALLPPHLPKKWKFQKNEKEKKKNAWRCHHFTKNYDYGVRQTDGQTEKVTYRGGCPT